MKIDTATQASYDGVGYYVSTTGACPTFSALGTVIGWAKKEQRLAGRTCFAISDALSGLYFDPADPAPLEKLQEDLIALLNSIGFETGGITFTESPSALHRRAPKSAQPAATAQLLSA